MSAIEGKADIELTLPQYPLFSPVAVHHPRLYVARLAAVALIDQGGDLRAVRRAPQGEARSKRMTNHADADGHAILAVPTR